jgi:RecB family exonuclease
VLLLPAALSTVEVPEFFSPSALGTWGGCALKLASASALWPRPVERLIAGPDAALGTLLHRVLERAARGNGASSAAIFDSEYERITEELRSDPRRRHYSDLSTTKTLAEWTRLRAWILERCDRITPRVGETAGGYGSQRQRQLTGPEIPLQSTSLRLRGRADHVRCLGANVFEVRDYKLGGVLSQDGTVKEEIVLQLRAYGLMLLDGRPGAAVRLIVDDGTDREVEFDDPARREARRRIQEIVRRLPARGSTPAEVLAKPGSGCWGCGVRHVCPAYRRVVPDWWRAYPPDIERIPHDVWGTVVEYAEGERIDVVLSDDAGRRVRVNGIDARHGLSRELIGQRLWFFELESSGPVRGFDGSRFHPRVFHELPRDRRERRAWRTQIFEEASPRLESTDRGRPGAK